MRLLPLMFMLFLGLVSPASAGELPASTKDMVHLSVIATDVRLRAGAGTEFAILGKASRDDFSTNRYIADSRPVMDSTGKPWFKLLANVQQQTELGVSKLDEPCWIRSDFVKTRALREGEAMRADSELFRILHISFDGMPGVAAFAPKQPLPVCSQENDCYFAEGKPETDASLPAGETFYLWGQPDSGSSGNVCISVWKRLDANRIQLAGTMPLGDFLKADLGADRQKVEAWLKKQNIAP